MRRILFLALCSLTVLSAGEYYYMNGGKRVALTPLTLPQSAVEPRQKASTLRFRDPHGRIVTISERLIVKFDTEAVVADFLNRYNLRIVRKYSFGAMYLLEAPDAGAAIEAANALAEEPGVIFAQPDIARKRILR